MKVILASKSPRRKELLNYIIPNFEVICSDEDETLEEGLDLIEQAKRLAFIKANSVFKKTDGDRIIIGSDTMVEKNGVIYGKPKDREDAIKMLSTLKNGKHNVITSLCVLAEKDGKIDKYLDYDITEVYIKDMTTKEIENWVDEDKPFDKAGGYALQSKFSIHIDKIIGNHNTVVGFPVHKLYDILKQIDKIYKIL